MKAYLDLFSNFPKFARTRLVFGEKCGLIFQNSGYCSCLWPRGFGYSSLFCGARFNGFTFRSYTSIEPSQSSLLLWLVVALNEVLLLRSQIGTAFFYPDLEFRIVNGVKSSAILNLALASPNAVTTLAGLWKTSDVLFLIRPRPLSSPYG